MKNLIKLFILFIAINCQAQSPVINIENDNGEEIQGAYYRDTNNLLNPFVGTYLFDNGTTYLKIVFLKKTLSYDGFQYEDVLIGEYQYKENGVEKSNTLSKINENFTNQNEHSISGNSILQMGDYQCIDCTPNEKQLRGGLVEYSTGNIAQFIIKQVYVNLQPAIKIHLWWEMRSYHSGVDPVPLDPSFPSGEYVLIKQP